MANTKISALTALTKSTVASNDVLPIVDTSTATTKNITYGELMDVQDNNFRVSGSADNTKKVAFEVDGLTTGTTRTITIPDASTTLVGTDTTQTMTNKTLTSPKVNVGADATGDIYYRDGSGNIARLPIGSAGQILDVSAGGLPEWIPNPSASNASTTVKGVVEAATTAEINAGTATGSTGAALAVTPDALAASAPTFSAANLTNVPGGKLTVITTDVTYASSTAENTLLSYSVPANTLGTTNAIRVTMHVNPVSITNLNSWTLRFKYGATTLTTYTYTASGGALGAAGKMEFLLIGAGSTSSQNGSFALSLGQNSYIGNANTVRQMFGESAQGTSAEDSTAVKTLAITSQHSNSNASDTITVMTVVVEKIF